MKKLLVISVAGLDEPTAAQLNLPGGGTWQPLTPSLPAVTCTSQASFRTASPPQQHGMVANGIHDRSLRKAMFWEQSSALVEGPRIWDAYRAAGGSVGMLFWQQSMGESVDVVLTPAPLHKHHGGLVLDCYSQPRSMYERLRSHLGEFPLKNYWGPLASARVGRWIADATADVMAHEAPDLLLTYLPTLDYDYQRYGPGSPRVENAVTQLKQQLATVLTACAAADYEWMIWGDYAITPARNPLFPNRVLRETGMLACRDIRGHSYPDLHASRAFAMVDHMVAHVYVGHNDDILDAAQHLGAVPGVAEALTGGQLDVAELRHRRCGDVVLVAEPGCWFAYPWWDRASEAPDYATHVDIHNKPGFDPCELFMQWFPPGVSQDATRIGGTHGRCDTPAAWTASIELESQPETLCELSGALQRWLQT